MLPTTAPQPDDALRALLVRPGLIIGLDPGLKTVGVAVGDVAVGVATPLLTLKRGKFGALKTDLEAILAERSVIGFVVGLPVNMDGTEGPRAQAARALARNLTKAFDLPAALWDERLSTAAVERELIAQDTSRARRAAMIDAHAAAFILQGALDRLRVLLRG